MSAFLRYLPNAAELLPMLVGLATWFAARALNVPPPLVQTAALVALLRLRDIETSVGKSLCPFRLWRRLRKLAT